MLKFSVWVASTVLLSMQSVAQAGEVFYVNPGSTAAQWVKQNPDAPDAAKIRAAIASVPSALWLTGTSQATDQLEARVAHYVSAAASAHTTPVLVAYNLPHRDCSGGASAGGAANAAAYRGWIDQVINGVGGNPAVLILEPDALPDLQCLSPADRSERLSLFNYAVSGFKRRAPQANVYLDAGNVGWKPVALMADALHAAGVKYARGFALNISNFYSLDQSRQYADLINNKLAADHAYTRAVVIDTSRNGNGAQPGDWCNPPGRKLGLPPQTLSPNLLALWIKQPGNSDGASSPKADCHGGPAAGTFSAELAVRLIDGE
ncbi:glycoside hydrolase family 6 protein [Pseudomonas tolaasii]|uniref:glycoside hydrolase family 6 protein n=1 Tax=Pseudomonas tolaasii TaxID=29442 RepID=UPI0015A0A027|nr:glycoside hydrolase family 6 protein [Pseudomonas tolaasii]NVZ44640.1 glycoside hydrolase family 6 protein [Pseudomonas tolaasii]NWA47501.1 glycoside hydrolase family 6 protein [Pseudomonas tolaasii]